MTKFKGTFDFTPSTKPLNNDYKTQQRFGTDVRSDVMNLIVCVCVSGWRWGWQRPLRLRRWDGREEGRAGWALLHADWRDLWTQGQWVQQHTAQMTHCLPQWCNVCSQTVTLWNTTDLWPQDSVTDVSLAVVHKTLVHNTQQILVHRVTLLYEIIVWKIYFF